MSSRGRRPLLPLVCVAAFCACQSAPDLLTASGWGEATPTLTEEELRAGLLQYSITFSSVITAAAQEISSRTRDRSIRRRALLWQVQMIPLAKTTTYVPDPQQAYVGGLALAVGMREYLVDGQGTEIFGEHQPIAVAAVREIEEDARELGARFLAPADLERLGREVEAVVRKNPIRGEFSPGGLVEGMTDRETRRSLTWVVDLPMLPFRALGGVNEGAQAIREINQTAGRLADLAAELPRLLRWQLELLLYDVEDRDTVLEGMAAFQELAESSSRLSQAAETLPETLSTDAAATLQSARATVAEANAALGQVQALLGPLGGLAEQVRAAGDAWGAAIREARGGGEPDPEARPFDIREYERTAQEISVAAAGLQELVAELHTLAETSELPAAMAGIEGGGRSLIDAAAWRLFQLMLAFFGLLLLYRLVGVWSRRRAA